MKIRDHIALYIMNLAIKIMSNESLRDINNRLKIWKTHQRSSINEKDTQEEI